MSEIQIYQAVIAGIVLLAVIVSMAWRADYAAKCGELDATRQERNQLLRERDDYRLKADRAQADLVRHLEGMDGYQEEAEWWRERFVAHIEGKTQPNESERE